MAPDPPHGGPNVVADQPITINEDLQRNFPRRFVRYLSLSHIFIFLFAVVMDVAFVKSNAAFGVWCGIFFAFSGAFGLVAQAKPTLCTVITVILATLLSAGISVVFIVFFCVRVFDQNMGDIWYRVCSGTLLFDSLAGAVTSGLLMSVTFRSVCCWKRPPVVYPNFEEGYSLGEGSSAPPSRTQTPPPKYGDIEGAAASAPWHLEA